MSYIYVVQMDIPAAHEAEFNRIYDTEHVPMLSKVPGVNRVSRYRLEQSNDSRMQKYLAIYEIDSPAVVESKEWEVAGAWGDWATKDPSAYHQPPPQLFRENLTPIMMASRAKHSPADLVRDGDCFGAAGASR